MGIQYKQITLNINGTEKSVLAEIIDKKFWCKVDGETYSFDVSDVSSTTSQRKVKSKGGSANQILAPMPGKITKVFVSSGEKVQKSQALLVMEAMKMEYTLKSDLETTVEKISVKVGDQVTLGQLLVQLAPIQ